MSAEALALGNKLLARMGVTRRGCWLWTGPPLRSGYAQVYDAGRMEYVHRAAWTVWRGPIPSGYQVDHLCRVRACFNPDHLEPVTQLENLRRQAAAQETCRNGHPRTPDFIRVDSDGQRRCRVCRANDRRDAQRRYRAKKKAMAA